MKILITGAGQPLGSAIAHVLRENHELRLTDTVPVKTDLDFVQADPRIVEDANRLLEGVEVLVHTASLPAADVSPDPVENEQRIMDWGTRGFYNLLIAAVEKKARRVLHTSTLNVVSDKADEYWVDERFRPRPHAEINEMTLFLGEKMALQFAIETNLEVVCLRLGKMVREDAVAGKSFDPDWVDVRDAAQACALAAETKVYQRYNLYHIAANTEASRWEVGHAMNQLGYRATHHFGQHPRPVPVRE